MDFLDLIKQGLERKDKRHSTDAHYPTNASFKDDDGKVYGTCLRSQYYQWKGEEPTNPPTFVDEMKMYLGNQIHKGLQGLAKEVDKELRDEISFKVKDKNLQHEIHGRMDVVYWNNGLPVGVEIKSGYGRKIDNIKKYGIPENYELQALCYLYARPDIDHFEMPFIARDSFYCTTFYIKRGESKFNMEGIIKRWKELEGYVEGNKLPPCDYDPIKIEELQWRSRKNEEGKMEKKQVMIVTKPCSWQCDYCAYHDLCQSEEASK